MTISQAAKPGDVMWPGASLHAVCAGFESSLVEGQARPSAAAVEARGCD